MTKIFYPTSERLRYLLDSIHNREVALPDFQRDFVWEPRETEELIESICQNFPAGSLLRIKNATNFYFAPREFAAAPPLNGHTPSYLILDGQQRLTSLYQALYDAGSHRYFMDLGALAGGADLEDCVFYLKKKDAKKRFGDLKRQAESLTFPLGGLLGAAGGFEEWLDRILELRPEAEAEAKNLKQRLREAQRASLRNIEDYEFPMVTLGESTTSSAVCTIFETLNRTGVKLSVFDLLAARFWPGELRLRDLWEDAQAKWPIIADFEVDPYYILQAVAIFASRAAPSCKRKDVLEMRIEQIRAGWGDVVKGLASGLQILRDECGVALPQWLPYQTILVPVAATMAAAARLKGPQAGDARNKLKRWFWCAVFGQAYEKAPNSQAAKDYSELSAWNSGGKEPDSVSTFAFQSASLRQTTPRQRAVYRGVMALVLRHGAKDFHQASTMTSSMMREQKVDDHHLFPQGYLSQLGVNVDPTLRDCVLNRTLIDKETDIRIGKRAPSDYLGEIETKIGTVKFAELLDSHLLPVGPDSPFLGDRFEEFLEARERLIAAEITKITQ